MDHKKCTAMHSTQWRPAHLLISLVFLASVGAPGTTFAQNQTNTWNWRFTMYGWIPTLEAETRLPSGGMGPSIEIDPDTLLDNLDMTFMAALQGRKGNWGFFTDLIYLDEGASGTLQREVTVGGSPIPADVSLDLRMDLKSWVWTFAPTYNLSQSSTHTFDSFFGFRMVDIDTGFDWTFNGDIGPIQIPERSGTVSAAETNWDAVIGVKGNTRFGSNGKWILPYQFDIGAGDSDLTWQAMAGIGYQFGWGAAILTYRHLDYDLESGGTITDLTFGGPMIGASFAW